MKKNDRVWTNGLKFDNKLAENLRGSISRVRSKKASLFIIDGGVGEGKTTLGVECAQYLAGELRQGFDIKDQVRQGGSDFLKGMDWCVKNKRNVIVYDEAGDFNTRASLTYFNQNMNRVFETYRALAIIVVLCLPSFVDVDTSIMKKKVARMLVHCYSRNNNYGNYKIYSLWRMWYLKAKFTKVTVPDDAFRMVSPNSYGRFKDLDPADSSLLENHSLIGKKDIIRKGMLNSRGLLTIAQIASKTGYSIDSIRGFIKRKKIVGEKSGATLYFHKDIVENIIATKEREGKVA